MIRHYRLACANTPIRLLARSQICMGAAFQQLVVYVYTGRAAGSTAGGPPPRPPCFHSFFALRYRLPLANDQEQLCKDFCLFLRGGAFVLLASQAPVSDPARLQRPAPPAELPGLPLAASTTLHVVGCTVGCKFWQALLVGSVSRSRGRYKMPTARHAVAHVASAPEPRQHLPAWQAVCSTVTAAGSVAL